MASYNKESFDQNGTPRLDDKNRTDTITFNCNDRKRFHTGRNRQYDLRAVNLLINDKVVQERVQHRDIFGYFGHWIREEFGVQPQEGGIIDGKIVIPEPALNIIELSADDKGNISFKVEFLDTPMGRMAKRLYLNKKGGFSIVWRFASKFPSPKQYPYEFFGFDFVIAPNFSGNRGYAMDSANSGDDLEDMAMDSTEGIGAMQSVIGLTRLVDSLQNSQELMEDTIARQQATIDELVLLNARGKRGTVAMDGINAKDMKDFSLPTVTKTDDTLANANDFLDVELVMYKKEAGDKDAQDFTKNPQYQQIKAHTMSR